MFGENLVTDRGWAESFKKLEFLSCDEILERVMKLENSFRIWMWTTLGTSLFGVIFWCVAYACHGPTEMGLYIALLGMMSNFSTKLSTQIRLATLRMLWDVRRREEAELRRSIAEDL
ncbi:MAG TPA: hypothetical protein PKH31_04385 [Candidatus Sumerlaeota bacterium]|nr:hypothetical protein [Candidatus Sumerlaeota bacterium]